jgi:hypothetical protein
MPRRLHAPAVALGVGALLGLVVAGVGSRLAMRAIALADEREDFGFRTEGGDVVGDVTLEGTLFVLVNGLGLGIVGALGYLVLRRWLPARSAIRTILFALLVLGLGLTSSITGNEADFEFVNASVSVLSFGVVLLLYGTLVPVAIDALIPHSASGSRLGRGAAIALVAAALASGALAVRHAYEIADGGIALG